VCSWLAEIGTPQEKLFYLLFLLQLLLVAAAAAAAVVVVVVVKATTTTTLDLNQEALSPNTPVPLASPS